MKGTPKLRREPRRDDVAWVLEVVRETGFFNAEEAMVAAELVEERLERGEESGYVFLFAELDRQNVAYSCFGPIPMTRSSWDLYWIAVDPACQGQGVGRFLLEASEAAARRAGAERIYLDTSTRAQYTPTRAFYEACGYRLEACLEDFYAPGDGKAIYVKVL